jgi:hypothetical protein
MTAFRGTDSTVNITPYFWVPSSLTLHYWPQRALQTPDEEGKSRFVGWW